KKYFKYGIISYKVSYKYKIQEEDFIMTKKVGLNGLGRIGRDFVRAYFQNEVEEFDLVSINASGDLDTLAHMLKYDTMYGKFDKSVEVVENGLVIDGKEVKITAERNPS